MSRQAGFVVRAVDPTRWRDVETLFGSNGASEGCWCMLWRLPSASWVAGKGATNRERLHELVDAGPSPGLLAYEADRPVGWCAVAQRTAYPRLLRSRMIKTDRTEAGVWSVPCFYVARDRRRRGVATCLLAEAVRYAADHGCQSVEGYPVLAAGQRIVASDAYPGTVEMFTATGFRELPSGSGRRHVMRLEL